MRDALAARVQRTIAKPKPKAGSGPPRRFEKENVGAGNATKALKPAVPTARALGIKAKPAPKPAVPTARALGIEPKAVPKPAAKPGPPAAKPPVPKAQGVKRPLRPERPAKMPKDETKTSFCRADFTPGEVLCNGQFGVVRKCTEKRSGRTVVLKVFDKPAVEAAEFTHQVKREVELQTHLAHPHILRAFCYFEDASKMHLVLEYAERGSLRNGLCCGDLKVRTYLRQHAARLVRELCLALQFCHERHIIHRDVKLENLLLTRDWGLKLADFGWAVRTGTTRQTLCGTPEYFAPEIHESYDRGVDVWCVGVVAHELLKRDVPPSPLPPPEDASWATVSADAQSFLRTLLVDKKERPDIDAVLQLPWLNSRPSQ